MDEASYAYLFEKNKAMMLCTRDLKYCTLDENGKPIPYCVRFPDDKKCVPNTIPPNILFMGCYSDSSCGGKTIVKSDKDGAPFAYTRDGRCQRSNDLCKWLTDKVAVPRCSETETIAQCQNRLQDYLGGCYTENTCGGQASATNNKEGEKNTPQPKEEEKTHHNQKKTKKSVIIAVVLLLVVLILGYFAYRSRSSHDKTSR